MPKELFNLLKTKKACLGVVGLGYVGLPLAYTFAKIFHVIGYDYNSAKIEILKKGFDPTGELPKDGLKEVSIDFTDDPQKIGSCQFIVIAVPTPVDKNKRPDLSPLIRSTETVGKILKPGAVVVYESTVYPGVTEEICVPILEKESKLVFGKDFTVGYSPERINPGDKEHRLETITKVVSGSDLKTLNLLSKIYGSIIKAGIYKASCIKVAEAAKVIENTQRDLNIALMNELAIIFHKVGIDTLEVLAAAGTKWNFLKFTPGLVGGHCIGVDPYYLTFKAEELGYQPQVILAGRRINDGMGKYVAENTVKEMVRAGKTVKGAKVLILGLSFKEDVGDIRNSRVIDIIDELKEYCVSTLVHDPAVDPAEAFEEYGLKILSTLNRKLPPLDAAILAVPHKAFRNLSLKKLATICGRGNKVPILIDVKGFFDSNEARTSGFRYWRL